MTAHDIFYCIGIQERWFPVVQTMALRDIMRALLMFWLALVNAPKTTHGFSFVKPLSKHQAVVPFSTEDRLTRAQIDDKHQRSQKSNKRLTIRACYACGRYATYSLYDGGVVAQAPINLEKFRKDYELSPYRINRINLDISIQGNGDGEDETLVKSTMVSS